MKDQYFGDFGDYQKVSLLNLLSEDLKVTVYWMKTVDDGGTDGKHIAYLKKPDIWRTFEPNIFDFIAEKIGTKKRRLSHIESSPYGKRIQFINKHIEDEDVRAGILKDICADKTVDVVFFDPDNGIEVLSTNKKNAHKYVTWEEISKTFNSGKSVMIYQHFSRVNREKFIKHKLQEIRKRLHAPTLALQVKHSVYFFILQERHQAKATKAIEKFSKIWKEWAVSR
jgi:hypothetical protein